MIEAATLPRVGRCGSCRASVAVSWHPQPTPQGCYVGGGFCRCGVFLVGIASPDQEARSSFWRDFPAPLAALIT